jgi:hypothetical protein
VGVLIRTVQFAVRVLLQFSYTVVAHRTQRHTR